MTARTNPGLKGYTTEECQNIALGQCGSVFISDTTENTAPNGLFYIAITVVNDCKFETLTQADNTVCFGDGGTASDAGPPGDLVANTIAFPSGLTIFGRWTTIDLAQGKVIAYLGQ